MIEISEGTHRIDPFGLADEIDKGMFDTFGVKWTKSELSQKKEMITKCCESGKKEYKHTNCFEITIWAPDINYRNEHGAPSMAAGHSSFGMSGKTRYGFHGQGYMDDDLDMKNFKEHSLWECCCLTDDEMVILGGKIKTVIERIRTKSSLSLPSTNFPEGESYPEGVLQTVERAKETDETRLPIPTCHGQAAAFGAGLGCPNIAAAAGRTHPGENLIPALKTNKFCRIVREGGGFITKSVRKTKTM